MSCPDKTMTRQMRLTVRKRDIFRATLADNCGNLGYLGIAPDASEYHVVVPVDLQLARGVKACNQPDDGTPFGGYRGWHYYECGPYAGNRGEESRSQQVENNTQLLSLWLQQLGIKIVLID
ncbi:hypothetical protein KAI46_09650 [bacterium]|nr:hypothetical protein [bacterium]